MKQRYSIDSIARTNQRTPLLNTQRNVTNPDTSCKNHTNGSSGLMKALPTQIAVLACILLFTPTRVESFSTSISRHTIARTTCGPLQSSNDEALENDEIDTTMFFSPNVRLNKDKFGNDMIPKTPDPSSITDDSEYSFFDEAIIYVRAGSGGQGASTYKKGLKNSADGIPDGGNGGRGGDVLVVVDESLNTLAGLTNAWRPNSFGGGGAASTGHQQLSRTRPMSFRGENGKDGDRQFKNGRFAPEITIRVPPGTVISEEIDTILTPAKVDPLTGETLIDEIKQTRSLEIGSVETHTNPRLIVAAGGEGGEGSGIMGNRNRGVKRPRAPPVGGERKRLKLTLKIVADVALVGVPNAGKSTFLASVTRAKPKIANYPFTTVIPNLGVWIPPDESGYQKQTTSADGEGGSGSTGLVLCDVPGLIAGAAEGVGLGHAFLRHVERCHVILHLVDATSDDPIGDFNMLNRELTRYGSGKLGNMPQIVVVNKIDAYRNEGIQEKSEDYNDDGSGSGIEEWEKGLTTRVCEEDLVEQLKGSMSHTRLMLMSAKERDGVDQLMGRMNMFVNKVKEID